jgi:hypothetical protein
MKHIWSCRRSGIAVIAIAALVVLGYTGGTDVSAALAAVAIGVAGANAYEKKQK